jgi:hypothetical protein
MHGRWRRLQRTGLDFTRDGACADAPIHYLEHAARPDIRAVKKKHRTSNPIPAVERAFHNVDFALAGLWASHSIFQKVIPHHGIVTTTPCF